MTVWVVWGIVVGFLLGFAIPGPWSVSVLCIIVVCLAYYITKKEPR